MVLALSTFKVVIYVAVRNMSLTGNFNLINLCNTYSLFRVVPPIFKTSVAELASSLVPTKACREFNSSAYARRHDTINIFLFLFFLIPESKI